MIKKEREEEMKHLNDESFDNFEFKQLYDIERRKAEYLKIKEKYPHRIPVIIAKLHDKRSQDLPDLDQNKFLIPDDFDFQQLQGVVRKRLQLKPSQVMYIIFKNNKIYGGGIYLRLQEIDKNMSFVYEHEKDEDGFLYLKYSGQEYTGY